MRLREAGQGCGQTQVSVGLATAGVGARVKYLEFLAFLGFWDPLQGLWTGDGHVLRRGWWGGRGRGAPWLVAVEGVVRPLSWSCLARRLGPVGHTCRSAAWTDSASLLPLLWIGRVTWGRQLPFSRPEVIHPHSADNRGAEGSLNDLVSIKSRARHQPAANTRGCCCWLIVTSLALCRSLVVATTRWPSAPNSRPGRISVCCSWGWLAWALRGRAEQRARSGCRSKWLNTQLASCSQHVPLWVWGLSRSPHPGNLPHWTGHCAGEG